MSVVIPNAGENIVLENYLGAGPLYLKLFSNNITPDETTTTASFNEVAGGGYLAKLLANTNWVPTVGDPTFWEYAQQTFAFTGPTNAPSTIYGYYVVDTLGVTRVCERFPAAVLPFAPIAGSSIKITPRLECS